MRHALRLSSSGRFAEGIIELAGLHAGTDLMLPTGQRPAVYGGKGVVGIEADLEVGTDAAWVALQLEKSSKYWAWITQLIGEGEIALTPGALPRLATKSASGIYSRLPLVEWGLAPLRVPGLGYAVSAADVAQRFEEARTPLPEATWAFLDAQITQETEARSNDR